MSNLNVRAGVGARTGVAPAQSIELRTKIFAANSLQLEALVRAQLETSFALEADDLTTETEDLAALREQELQQSQSYEDFTGHKMSADGYAEEPFRTLANPLSEAERLADQLHYARLSEPEKRVAAYVLVSLDEDGYFRRPAVEFLAEVREREGIQMDERNFERLLAVVRALDPPGLGSRSTKEFYQASIMALPENKVTDLAMQVVSHCYESFQKRRFDRIADGLQIKDEYTKGVLKQAVGLIQSLPTARRIEDETTSRKFNVQQPDVLIRRHMDSLRVQVNTPRIVQSLHLRGDLHPLLNPTGLRSDDPAKRKRSEEQSSFVRAQVRGAQEFLTLCNTRRRLMEKFFTILAKEQREFFLTGDHSKLKPLQQRDMVEHPELIKIVNENYEAIPKEERDFADKVAFSASMVSTLVNNKSIDTDFGVVPVKTLFDKKFDKGQDVAVTRTQVTTTVLEALNTEDRSKPLTDDKIAELITKEFQDMNLKVQVSQVQNLRKRLHIPDAAQRQDLSNLIDQQLKDKVKPIAIIVNGPVSASSTKQQGHGN